MTRDDKAVLIAMIFGKGEILTLNQSKCKKRLRSKVVIEHSPEDLRWLEKKAKLMHRILGGKYPEINQLENGNYQLTKCHKYWRILRNYLYYYGEKTIPIKALNRMTPSSILTWWLDQGQLLENSDALLITNKSEQENQVIIDYFKETHNVEFIQNPTKPGEILCTDEHNGKFFDIISRVPNSFFKRMKI